MIQLGNGILLESNGSRFRFDPRRVTLKDVGMISHAHTDHLPSSFQKLEAICSPESRDLLAVRRKKEISIASDSHVKMLEAGHIAGSRMFLVKTDEVVLYTGDFCTREKKNTQAAKPHKCDVLITEATYGLPRYVFPDHREIMSIVRDWLDDLMREGTSAVLLAYPLGKSQELGAAFADLPLVMHANIAENNRVLAKHGYKLPLEEYDPDRTKPPFVYVTSGYGKDALRVESMRKHGAKTAAFSGWALDRGFSATSRVDEAFPVSDHCGFNELLEFVRRCSPSQVFTTHGFAKEFAVQVRRNLGIPAQPLVARQRTLDHFC
jgi:putative mRNA 3-end processing factor